MPELFNLFTTVFLALWLVSFLSGQTSFRGEFSFIVFIMLFMVFLPTGIFLYHTLVCGLSITLWYTGPVVFNSAGRLSKYFFKRATRHLFLPVANILGVASRGLTHSPPPLAFVLQEKWRIHRRHHLFEMRSLRPSYHCALVGRVLSNALLEATELC